MEIYDETVLIDVRRGFESLSVPFCEVREGDYIVDLMLYAGDDAHVSEDPDYSGWVFYDDTGCAWFPEDFGADLKEPDDD